MRMRRVMLGAAALAAILAAGCRTVSHGARAPRVAVSERVRGVSQEFAAPPATVVQATAGALRDLSVRGVSNILGVDFDLQAKGRAQDQGGDKDSAAGQANLSSDVSGLTADNRPIRATIEAKEDRSLVIVRVGPDGDDALSRAVLARIAARLATGPGPAAATAPAGDPAQASPGRPYARGAVPDSIMLREQAQAGYRDTPVP
jgi:hypothetical protein